MKYLGLWSPGLQNVFWKICKTLCPPSPPLWSVITNCFTMCVFTVLWCNFLKLLFIKKHYSWKRRPWFQAFLKNWNHFFLSMKNTIFQKNHTCWLWNRWILKSFYEHHFFRTLLDECFWLFEGHFSFLVQLHFSYSLVVFL